jgi:hypothetical protein
LNALMIRMTLSHPSIPKEARIEYITKLAWDTAEAMLKERLTRGLINQCKQNEEQRIFCQYAREHGKLLNVSIRLENCWNNNESRLGGFDGFIAAIKRRERIRNLGNACISELAELSGIKLPTKYPGGKSKSKSKRGNQ